MYILKNLSIFIPEIVNAEIIWLIFFLYLVNLPFLLICISELGSIRSKLVYMLSDHDVIKLLRCLWEMNVFNDKQKKTVEGKMTREDKARCLIYTVMGKGVTASSLMVDYLTEKHPELCLTLGLTPTSARISELTCL